MCYKALMTRTLLLIRHAQADERGPKYPDDSLRPLVAKGHQQTAALAEVLNALALRPDRLFSSPYRRAIQTAEPLTQCVASGALELLEGLAADDYSQLLAELEAQLADNDGTIALVGHEPYLSELSSLLLTGNPNAVTIKFKKAALVVLEGPLEAGQMTLALMLPPRLYKLLAKRKG